jgi:CheY-like chemotaxis protein
MLAESINILLVEDNPADARLAREALAESQIPNNLFHVADGVEAIEFLARRGSHSKAPRPDLILLDLNLPKKDGREVLRNIKHDDSWKRIPVIVMTVSEAERDVLECYNCHANCYLTKPLDFNVFLKLVRSIENFWLNLVRLPSE